MQSAVDGVLVAMEWGRCGAVCRGYTSLHKRNLCDSSNREEDTVAFTSSRITRKLVIATRQDQNLFALVTKYGENPRNL